MRYILNAMSRHAPAAATCYLFGLLVPVVVVLVPSFSHAESVLWSTRVPNLCTVMTSGTCWSGWALSQGQAQVKYNVRVVNASTGEVLASGATVPSGTRVKFEFMPHASSDIYWFGHGHGYDSPYGDWIAGAAKPSNGVCWSKNYFGQVGADRDRGGYASLSVNPPEKSIQGLPDSCSTAQDGVSKICTLASSGQIRATFSFASTRGKFWGAHGITTQNGTCLGDAQNLALPLEHGRLLNTYPATPYTLDVPTRNIPFSITVGETSGSAPSVPSVSGSGACIVGQPYTISMTATDPDNDDIRYGIDWNADGTIDQRVPPPPQGKTYVPSGTSVSASRTYSTAGERTIKVNTQDTSGNTSIDWTTHSFTCSDAGGDPCVGNRPANTRICLNDTSNVPQNTSWLDVQAASGCTASRKCEYYPSHADGQCTGSRPIGMTICPNDTSNVPQNMSWLDVTETGCTTVRKCEYYASDAWCDNGLNKNRYPSCKCPVHQEQQGSVCVVVGPRVNVDFRAAPALVRAGDSSRLFWNVANVDRCNISGPDFAHSAPASPADGLPTPPITQRTIYTMTCWAYEWYTPPSFTQTATVDIAPSFKEL